MIKFIKQLVKSKNTAGLTIVELLLYMGLFMGFIAILSALFVSTLDVQSDSTATSHTDQDSWYVLNRLQYDLYRADSVITPANNGDTSTSLVLDVGGSQVTYSLVNNQLSITENSVTEPIVSNQVTTSNLSFQRLGNDGGAATITVQMELQNSVSDQVKAIDVTVGLR